VTTVYVNLPVGALGLGGGAAVAVSRAAASGVSVTANATFVGTSVGVTEVNAGAPGDGATGTDGCALPGLAAAAALGAGSALVGVVEPHAVASATSIHAPSVIPSARAEIVGN
jgi:hypothetical protein